MRAFSIGIERRNGSGSSGALPKIAGRRIGVRSGEPRRSVDDDDTNGQGLKLKGGGRGSAQRLSGHGSSSVFFRVGTLK